MRPEHWLYTIPLRLRSLFRRAQADKELDDELRDHLERKTEEFVAQGMTREQAHRRARLDMDGIEQTKEKCRDARRVNWIQDLVQDLRYGLRVLRKSPGFTTIAVLTLALGIGADTALFSIVNGVLLKPLPYLHPDELVSLYVKVSNGQEIGVSYPNFLDWQRNNKTFASMAASFTDDFTLSGLTKPERLHGERVSASVFSVFDVKPVIGRVFTSSEDQLGAAPVALISDGLWERRFGSSSEILSKAITLSGSQYIVIGVLSEHLTKSFYSDQRIDVYIPIGQWNDYQLRDRGDHTVAAVGRLRAGVTLAPARADMADVARNLATEYPEANGSEGVSLVPLKQDIVGDVQPVLLYCWEPLDSSCS